MTIPGEVADGICSYNALNTRSFALFVCSVVYLNSHVIDRISLHILKKYYWIGARRKRSCRLPNNLMWR